MEYISEENKKEVVRKYMNGQTATKLAKKLFPNKDASNSRRNIYNWINKCCREQARKQKMPIKNTKPKKKYSNLTKYSFVMRYINGESDVKLAKEMWPYKDPHIKKGFIKIWKKELIKNGIIPNGLKRIKKKKINYQNFSKEELIEIIKVKENYDDYTKREKLKKFEFIDANKFSALKIKNLCLIFGVSISGFYKYKKSTKQLSKNEKLTKIVKNLFFKHNKNIGYRKMTHYVYKETKIKYNHKKIYRIMKDNNLQAEIRTKDSKVLMRKYDQKFPYLINRNFFSNKPFKKLLTDVSTIKLNDYRNSYLSPVMDLYNREIVSFEFKIKKDKSLIVDQLAKIASNLKDDEKPIINSDHGVIYFSKEYQMIANNYFEISMSRIGNCLDNQPIEYFFSIIKQECIKKIPFYERTFERLNFEIKKFMEYYNKSRIQSYLKYRTPYEYKRESKYSTF